MTNGLDAVTAEDVRDRLKIVEEWYAKERQTTLDAYRDRKKKLRRLLEVLEMEEGGDNDRRPEGGPYGTGFAAC